MKSSSAPVLPTRATCASGQSVTTPLVKHPQTCHTNNINRKATMTAKLHRRLRSAEILASWPRNPLVRAFGRMMVRRLTAAIKKAEAQ